jgi:FkbM family methyltransferase
MLIFDIGYNSGLFSMIMLSTFENCKIIGIDANKTYINLSPKASSKIKVLNYAISDKNNEIINFYICDANLGISSTNEEWMNTIRHKSYFDKSKRIEKIKTITLDKLIENYGIPDLIKLDIEGSEYKALCGLSKKCGTILFEWSEEYFSNALLCVERLKSIGYTLFGVDIHYEGDGERYYNPNIEFKSWEELNLTSIIDYNRKSAWGMIYAK